MRTQVRISMIEICMFIFLGPSGKKIDSGSKITKKILRYIMLRSSLFHFYLSLLTLIICNLFNIRMWNALDCIQPSSSLYISALWKQANSIIPFLVSFHALNTANCSKWFNLAYLSFRMYLTKMMAVIKRFLEISFMFLGNWDFELNLFLGERM